MFVKNNPVAGYVNGTVGEVVDFSEGGVDVDAGTPRLQRKGGGKKGKTGNRFVFHLGCRDGNLAMLLR